MTLALTTIAVAWLLTLGTILVARSGHTVATLAGLLENGQRRRGAAAREVQEQVRRVAATTRQQLADDRRAATAAGARARHAATAVQHERAQARTLRADVRSLRARIRQSRAERQALVREVQTVGRELTGPSAGPLGFLLTAADPGHDDVRTLMERIRSATSADAAAARTALDAERTALAGMRHRIDDAIAALSALAARERAAGRAVDDLVPALTRLEDLRADVARADARIRRARDSLRPRPRPRRAGAPPRGGR